MKLILNLLWLAFGGWTTATTWFVAALMMAISVVGLPWARAAFNIGLLNLWPFGSRVVDREHIRGADLGTSPLGTLGNILWFVFCGWWLTLFHLFWGIVLCITILGIPFGLQHFKLARISVAPIGKAIVF